MLYIKTSPRRIAAPIIILAALAFPLFVHAAPIILDDFEDGVSFTRDNIDPMRNNSWICVDVDFGTEASESMLDGSKAMKITDSPDKYNGLYAIYPGVIPENNNYFVRCKLKFHEVGTDVPFSSYMIACTVGGGHRVGGNTISITPRDLDKAVPVGVLTADNDSHKPALYLQSTDFYAGKDADIRVMLSTANNYFAYSSTWQQSYVLVDEVALFRVGDSVPVSLSNWTLE